MPDDGRVSQVVGETLTGPGSGSADARTSQVVGEVLTGPGAGSAHARASQVAAETLVEINSAMISNGRASQVVAETLLTLGSGIDNGRVSQIVAEVLCPVVTFGNVIPVFPDLTYSVFSSNPIAGRGWSLHKKPTFAVIERDSTSGRAVRSPQQSYPLWEFNLTYEVMRDQTQNQQPYQNLAGFSEFQAISELFLFCNGQGGSFYYNDPEDNSRTGQQVAIGDSNTHIFPIVRTWGFGAQQFIEPIGGINVLQNVYWNGVLQSPTTYYVMNNNLLWFSSAPPTGTVVTADFSFFYLCRFIEDQQDYEEFFKNLWSIGSVKFRSMYGTH